VAGGTDPLLGEFLSSSFPPTKELKAFAVVIAYLRRRHR
jgi:hypothetical protein